MHRYNWSPLNSENGLKILLDKIKSLYTKDIHSLAYIAYDKFQTFHSPVEMNIVDYLNEFERLYNQIKQYDMELPTGVLADRVLKNANITHEKQQLLRATLNSLIYENMKKQLKAIYDSSFDSTSTQTTGIEEEVFYSKSDGKNDYNKKREFKQQNYRRYRKDNGNRYQKDSNRYQKDGSNKSVKEDNVDRWGRKINPKSCSGNTSRCAICQSIYHWANKCPDRHDDDTDSNKINVTLFSEDIFESYSTKFVGETLNGAVLDSGCTQTVCGRSWLSNYIDSLTDDDKLKVKEKKSNTVFKFGDGKLFNSLKLVTIPAKIGSKYVDINTNVIDSELPLLLSKNAIKLAKVKIDFDNDIINIFGEDIDISFTASGHYFIPISRTNKAISEIDESNPAERILLNIANIASKSKEEKLKIAKKLHCQFGHASAQKLQKLVKSSSIKDVELLIYLMKFKKNVKFVLNIKSQV